MISVQEFSGMRREITVLRGLQYQGPLPYWYDSTKEEMAGRDTKPAVVLFCGGIIEAKLSSLGSYAIFRS
jgi:hypothetical protein